MSTDLDRLVYDWNRDGRAQRAGYRMVELDDETLRDGLQSPSVHDPPIAVKKRLLYLMDALGIDSADIGLPGASDRARAEIVELARETTKLTRLRPNQAIRTHPTDVRDAIRAAVESGVAIETCAFIGSSPIRRYAEDWSLDGMLKNVEDSVTALAQEGLPVMFVTEDTTRADPATLVALYETAIACGAKRICFSDTVGHATPDGVRNLLKFARDDIVRGRDVKIDFHGHNDRGLGLGNALAATELADRVHGCALGIGERVGNSPMDQLLVNLYLWGFIDRDLSPLVEYVRLVSEHCGVQIPPNYPMLGSDAFRTATGVHAAAVVKAFRKGDRALADRVYSGVPASVIGRGQLIEIGPMSGGANVVFWLEQRGYEPTRDRIDRVMEAAKASDRLLTEAEVRAAADAR